MAKNNDRNGVLVSRFSALGDVAMTIPSLYETCRSNPELKFYMLTKHHPATLFINAPENLTVIPVDLSNYKGIKGIWRLSNALMRRYDIGRYVDLHDVIRTRLLRLFLLMRGVKVRHINKGRHGKKRLTRRRNKVVVPLKLTTARYEDTFEAMGLSHEPSFTNIFNGQKGDPALFSSVAKEKPEGQKWLAIAPFAQHRGKVYPIELLEKVIDWFDNTGEWKIFMLGAGESETTKIERIATQHKHVVNVAAARLGMEAEMALMSHCDVMLSMDSANMHLASLAGLRVVSIWGATHPFCGFMGWRQKEEDAVQLDMVCRPCSVYGNKVCHRGDYHCLWGITPQIVIQRIIEGLRP